MRKYLVSFVAVFLSVLLVAAFVDAQPSGGFTKSANLRGTGSQGSALDLNTSISITGSGSFGQRVTANQVYIPPGTTSWLSIPFLEIYPTLEPAALPAGFTRDWFPTDFQWRSLIYVTPDAAGSTIGSIRENTSGDVKILVNSSDTASITLTNEDLGEADPTERIKTPGGTDYVIAPGASALLVYTFQRYRVIGVAGGTGGGGGTITDFVLGDVTSHLNLASGTHHDVTPTDWATNTRHYLGGDATLGSTVTGFDDLPLGTIRFIELGDRNSKGPITILPYDHATSTGSLGANRIVTPDNQPLRVDPGGMFAMVYIGGGPLHGWRVLWSTTTANPRIGIKHLRFYDKLSATLPSGVTNNWAPTNGLEYTRWRVTVDINGSTLHGITHNSSSTPGIGDGEIRIIENVGDGIGSTTAMLTLAHMGAGTASDNSFFLPNAANVVLPPNGSAIFVRDSTLDAWRMVSSTTTSNFNRGPALTPTALPSGDTNDWNPTGFANYTRIRVTPNAAGSTLTGLLAGKDGEIKILEVLYAPGGSLTLAEYRTSAGANSFVLPGLVDLVIPPGGSAIMIYDNTLQIWKVAGLAGSAGGGSGDITDVTVTSPACSAGSYMTTLTGGSTSGSAPVGGTCTAEVGDVSAVVVTDPACSAGSFVATLTGGAVSGSAPVGGTCVAEVGDVSSVVAGNGLVTGGASGAVTVDVGSGTNITVNANDVALATNVAIAGTLSVLVGAATVADFRGTVISPSVTGTHTAWAPTGIATATVIDIQPTGSIDLVGMTTGALGRIVTIRNANNIGYNVTIYDEGGTASPGDRFDLGSDTHWTIKAGDAMTFVYTSASRWASIGHVGRQYPGLFLTGDLAMGGASITGALNGTFTGTLTVGGLTTMSGGAILNGKMEIENDAGKISTKSGGAVTYTNCGTGYTALGDRTAGHITMGTTPGSCEVDWTTAFTADPTCQLTARGSTKTFSYTANTDKIVMATPTAGQVYDWFCVDHH